MDKFKLGNKKLSKKGFNEFCWKHDIKCLQDLGNLCGISRQRVDQVLKKHGVSTWFFKVVRSKLQFQKLVAQGIPLESPDGYAHYKGDLYITNEGIPFKKKKEMLGGNLIIVYKNCHLKKSGRKSPYPRISYTLNGERHTEYLHRVVAKIFCYNPQNEDFVNHIDGNKDNYHPDNLEWVTHQENIQHSMEVLGTHTGVQSEKEYIIVDPSGRELFIRNLAKWCRDNNMAYQGFIQVLNGRSKITQGGWKVRRIDKNN